MKYRKNKKRS